METLPPPSVSIENASISQLEVLSALQSLDTLKSMGIGPKAIERLCPGTLHSNPSPIFSQH